ncbi:MAG: anthranilate synthase component I, partial [Chloroflexi bacterium]|nr:anthranilate synthase component I [Chloroflexota bacterium]
MLLNSIAVKTIVRELPADLETPISVYLKLRGENPSFLLESVEGGERIARYSFIGIRPRAQYILRGNEIQIIEGDSSHKTNLEQAGLPRFIGGLVGYIGYESVRHFEPTLASHMQASIALNSGLPDSMYLLADTVVAFDHARRSLFLIANVLDGDEAAANRKLDEITVRMQQPLPAPARREPITSTTRSNMTQNAFEKMVAAAKEHISAGDIFQVVLSQR